MHRLCGDGVPKKVLESSSNGLRIVFVSDGFSEVRGFKILFRMVAPAGSKLLSFTSGRL